MKNKRTQKYKDTKTIKFLNKSKFVVLRWLSGQVVKWSGDCRGMAAILTVIIVSAAALIVAFSASILGLGEMDMGYTAQKGQQSMSFVNGCAEESLRQLQLNASWTGGILNFNDGSCIIGVVVNGNNRTLTISGTVDNFTKKLQILAIVNNGMVSSTSWQELEN